MRIWLICIVGLSVACCKDDQGIDPGDLSGIPYQPTSHTLQVPQGYPQLEIPADNPLTEEGIHLGRMLFYDPILSSDSTMSCGSCHLQSANFTDNLPVSTGVLGMTGRRSAMSLLDVAFHYNGLFWDGRSPSLEEQALLPVEDPVELHESWPNVEEKLRRHSSYPEAFRKAFGISHTSDITRELAAKALAQFQRTLVSSGQSKFDKHERLELFLNDNEYNGFLMFFDKPGASRDAECGHCHALPLFTINEYRNNGIEPITSIHDFPDKGRGALDPSSDTSNLGKFKVPTLRNIEFSAPYMHDGRFATLEEVIDHYASGGHRQSSTDPLIYDLKLTNSEKQDLLAFLKTLSDTTFLKNPAFSNPF